MKIHVKFNLFQFDHHLCETLSFFSRFEVHHSSLFDSQSTSLFRFEFNHGDKYAFRCTLLLIFVECLLDILHCKRKSIVRKVYSVVTREQQSSERKKKVKKREQRVKNLSSESWIITFTWTRLAVFSRCCHFKTSSVYVCTYSCMHTRYTRQQ